MKIISNFIRNSRNEGVISACVTLFKNVRFKIYKKIYFNKSDIEHWKKIKGKYIGKTVYLIGNGPSLNKMPLYLLKDRYTMTFNHFSVMEERLNWKSKFFMVTDHLVINDLINEGFKEIEDCTCAFVPKIHQQGIKYFKKIKPNKKMFWLRLGAEKFSTLMPDVCGGGTVVFPGMQVLNYMGFSKIVIIGVDMNYKIQSTANSITKFSTDVTATEDDDPNHFDSRYFGKGKSFHQPKKFIIEGMMDSLNYIGANQNKYGTNIVNAGVDSQVDCFPREEFIKTLGLSDEDIKIIFEELLQNKTCFSSVNEFVNKCRKITVDTEALSLKEESFYMDMELGLVVIKKMVASHLPLGPYNGLYFFVCRNNDVKYEKKKILFDLDATQPAKDIKRHGGGIYGEIVFRRLVEKNIELDCFYDSSKWLNPEIKDLCEQSNIKLHDIRENNLQTIIDRYNFGLLYSPRWSKQLSGLKINKLLLTIHDIRKISLVNDSNQLLYRLRKKELLKFLFRLFFNQMWLKMMLKRQDAIFSDNKIDYVTVSEYSKYCFMSYFPNIKAQQISVMYCPPLNLYRKKLPSKSDNFFLMVSGNIWYKNILRVIKALDALFSENRLEGYHVRICGAYGKEFRYKLKNPDKFEFMGYVDDNQLNMLYSKAYSFIFPSLNEGFGSPPLEFMAYGKPVLASSITSITEICGDAPIYFNPFDIYEIKTCILKILDKDIYSKHSNLSLNRYEIVYKRQLSDLDRLVSYISDTH